MIISLLIDAALFAIAGGVCLYIHAGRVERRRELAQVIHLPQRTESLDDESIAS
jgi:hypothetical protein